MKRCCIFFCLCLCFLGGCANLAKEEIVELPLTFEKGYGPFEGAMFGKYLFPGDKRNREPYPDAVPSLRGVPDDWSDVVVSYMEADVRQFLYQNYRSGKVPGSSYERLLEAWDWEPDTTTLSERPIRCFVSIVSGIDSRGEWKVIADRNGNLDFSDDVPFEPLRCTRMDPGWLDSMASQSFPVRIELYAGSRVIETEIPLYLVFSEQFEILLYAFPQYAACEVDGHRLGVFSTHMRTGVSPFTNAAFRSFSVAEIPDTLSPGAKLLAGAYVTQDEYLILDGVFYIPLEVDLKCSVLRLQRSDLTTKNVHSMQDGFQAPFFQGPEFTSHKNISLEDYRGKYLFVEFWSDKCAPCLGMIPAWNALYDKMDTTRFAMLGIVYCKNSRDLSRIIEQKGIHWPQIRLDSTNRIDRTYRISSFPSSFLLEPNGTILARNLTPEQLKARMREYFRK